MRVIVTLGCLLFSFYSWAGPKCTDKPQSQWMSEAQFKKEILKDTYKVKVFKKTRGNCYEIYGWDKSGKKVEIYFHPITGKIIKQRNF